MFCTNDLCENETVPESGDLHLCRPCHLAWQGGFKRWTQVLAQSKTYHTLDSLLIRLPKPFDENLFPDRQGLDTWSSPNSLPFNNLFETLPPNRLACGFLELGEWLGNEYEAEFQIALRLGPDGKVWAEIGEVEELPVLTERDRESLAVQMVDEFLEACDNGESCLDEGEPTREALRLWPVPRVMHWLQLPSTLHRADPMQRRLITGLLSELRALGFQPKP